MAVPSLVIGIGNPSRGDDALGFLCIERLKALGKTDVEFLTDFQLQVEYVLDLEDRERVFFVDAAVKGEEPWSLNKIEEEANPGMTTHAMAPGVLLAHYRQHFGKAPPDCQVLAIRGYSFDLGAGLSEGAKSNLDSAVEFMKSLLAGGEQ